VGNGRIMTTYSYQVRYEYRLVSGRGREVEIEMGRVRM
jgi:hypothetical protein